MLEQARQHGYDDRHTIARLGTRSIMQQQNVAGGETSYEPMQYRGRVSAEAVQSAPCPGNVAEIRLCHKRIQQGATEASWRAKECRSSAGDRMNYALRLLDLTPQCKWRIAGESIGVSVTVVLHAMSAADNITHDFRVCSGTP